MKLTVPTLGAAAGGIREITEAVAGLPGTTARAAALIPRAESLMARIESIAEDAERALARANEAIDRIDAAAARAGASIDHIDQAAGRADAAVSRAVTLVDGADGLVARTATLVDDAGGLVSRTSALLSAFAGPLADIAPAAEKLVPAVRRVAETVNEREVDAVVGLIDELPQLLDALKTQVLPVMRQLGPDVHATMEIVDDVRDIINGLPGAGLFRRRGEAAADG